MKHPIQTFDLHKSFGNGQEGAITFSLIGVDGEQKLDRTMWEAGSIAYQHLMLRCEDALSAEGYTAWVKETKLFLNEDFFPVLMQKSDAGNVEFKGASRADLMEAWKEYDWVEKLMLSLQMVDQTDPDWLEESSDPSIFKVFIAMALLWRLDSAIMSEFFDGNGLVENILDVVRLRDLLNLPETIKSAIDSAKKTVRREQVEQASARGRAAAEALHNKPGNSRDKQEAIRAAWASGKYSSRDLCAEQECAALNMAPGTARKALRNTPEPPRRCIA